MGISCTVDEAASSTDASRRRAASCQLIPGTHTRTKLIFLTRDSVQAAALTYVGSDGTASSVHRNLSSRKVAHPAERSRAAILGRWSDLPADQRLVGLRLIIDASFVVRTCRSASCRAWRSLLANVGRLPADRSTAGAGQRPTRPRLGLGPRCTQANRNVRQQLQIDQEERLFVNVDFCCPTVTMQLIQQSIALTPVRQN